MDLKILLYIQEHMKNDVLDFILPGISFLSNAGWIWIIIAIILCVTKKYRNYGYALSIGLILCLLVGNVILKPLVARVRPYDAYNYFELIIDKLHDFSFPSGHTYSAFCGATILFFANRKLGYVAFFISILTAFSRLYLFVHYPSDVFVGMIMGVLFAFISLYIVKILSNHFKEKELNLI